MGIVDPDMYDRYKVGDMVKITDGTFKDMDGQIVNIDKDTNSVSVEMMFFGRKQVVDNIEFYNIEKI